MIKDIDNTWVISDTHFGHENIVRLCKRPLYADALMLDEWTRLVPPDALVLHLGDVVYRADLKWWESLISELPGDKKLILGNHDKQPAEYYERCGFEIISPFVHPWRTKYVSFDHYPMEGKTTSHELRIHGHLHSSGYGWKGDNPGSPARVGHCNISVEMTKYQPVNLGVLLRAYFS